MEEQRTIIIGVSGCSSSGKTTLARLLRDMFPDTFILHEDDFYKPESEIPIKSGLVDWDCPEAISIPDLEAALAHVRATGTFPPTVDSKEDLNSVGPSPLTESQLAACTAKVRAWLAPGQPGSLIFAQTSTETTKPDAQETTKSTSSTTTITAAAATNTTNPTTPPAPSREPPKTHLCILDGFLLYSPPKLGPIMSLLDIRLFLRVSKAAALRRREARDGYVTLEGFWKDPPGYVEKIVWPNYVEEHCWMFEDGKVDGGKLDREVVRREGIFVVPGNEGGDGGEEGIGREDVEFGEVVEWAVGVVMRELERIVLGGGRSGEGKDAF